MAQPTSNGGFEGLQRRLFIRPLGHNADGAAAFDAEFQQGNQAFAVDNLAVVPHMNIGGKLFGQINKGSGRTGVQAVSTADNDLNIIGELWRH